MKENQNTPVEITQAEYQPKDDAAKKRRLEAYAKELLWRKYTNEEAKQHI